MNSRGGVIATEQHEIGAARLSEHTHAREFPVASLMGDVRCVASFATAPASSRRRCGRQLCRTRDDGLRPPPPRNAGAFLLRRLVVYGVTTRYAAIGRRSTARERSMSASFVRAPAMMGMRPSASCTRGREPMCLRIERRRLARRSRHDRPGATGHGSRLRARGRDSHRAVGVHGVTTATMLLFKSSSPTAAPKCTIVLMGLRGATSRRCRAGRSRYTAGLVSEIVRR
jgi:hypothetical protein